MTKRHVVDLTDDQRADLEGRFCGRLTLRERNRVQVLLRSDAGDTDDEIADAVGVCVATVVAVRKRFAAGGLDAALGERPRSGGPARFDGKVEAAVVAVACSPAPEGRAEWTVGLIAGRLVELGVVESISGRTVGRVLKKVASSRGRRRRGACPAG
jgi:transposase